MESNHKKFGEMQSVSLQELPDEICSVCGEIISSGSRRVRNYAGYKVVHGNKKCCPYYFG